MLDGIKYIYEIILDQSKHWTLKSALFISVIALLFILDYTLSVSYDNYTANKLGNLVRITALKKSYENDTTKLQEILRMEKDVINRKHYSEYVSSFFYMLVPKINYLTTEIKNIDIDEKTLIIDKNDTRSYFWMLLSSNLFLLILAVILLFSPFTSSDKITLASLLGWFASLVILLLIIGIITWVSFKIPLINKQPIYNYSLNGFLQLLILFFIGRMKDTRGES